MGLALTKLTVTDVVSQVKSIGTAYHQYEDGILSNSIDGRTLFLLQEEDIADCFRAVGVVNKLHWIKLKLHFQDLASGRHNLDSCNGSTSSTSSVDNVSVDGVHIDDNTSTPVEFCMSVGTIPRASMLTETSMAMSDSGSTSSECSSDTQSVSSGDGPSITRRGKFRLSCNRCTLYKKKCVGKPRCENCVKHDKECVFNERLRPGPSVQSGVSGLGSGAQSRLVSKIKRPSRSVIPSSSLPVQANEDARAAPTADAVLLLSSTVFAPLSLPSYSDSDDSNRGETIVGRDPRIATEYYQSDFGSSIGNHFNTKSSFGYV